MIIEYEENKNNECEAVATRRGTYTSRLFRVLFVQDPRLWEDLCLVVGPKWVYVDDDRQALNNNVT